MTGHARPAHEPCADHATLAVQLAGALGRPQGAWVDARLRALADRLPAAASPGDELSGLGALLDRNLTPRRTAALLLPEVLATGAGHPLAIAVTGAAIAARAELAIGLVGAGSRLYLAHEQLDPPLVLDPARPGAPVDARRLGRDLHWRCAYEAAHALLERLAERAERRLDLATATACAALRLMLPLDDDSLEAAMAEHGRLLARLN